MLCIVNICQIEKEKGACLESRADTQAIDMLDIWWYNHDISNLVIGEGHKETQLE